jgi:ATP-dependent protease HslVU (ClpYQ) peptidase subunit
MTCIVGLSTKGKVFIGGDSAGVSGWNLEVRKDSKVFRNGSFVFGFTSSFRMGQLLRYKFEAPEINTDDIYKYMVTSFVDSIRDCFKGGGYASKEKEQESGGVFLVGLKDRLFEVDSDYQVGESLNGIASCGCGDQIAKGSLFSSRGKSPEARVRTALEAAESFSAGVRGPFIILST